MRRASTFFPLALASLYAYTLSDGSKRSSHIELNDPNLKQMTKKILAVTSDEDERFHIVVWTHTTRGILTGPTFVPVGKFCNDFCNGRARPPEGCFEHKSVYKAHPHGPKDVLTHQNIP